MSLDEIKNFRQWGSLTPGHPEYGYTSGIETTTGPLGQGCGNSVGMAIAGKWLAARYNKPGFELFDYNVYVQCSDGVLMEGVCCEAASLAGTDDFISKSEVPKRLADRLRAAVKEIHS